MSDELQGCTADDYRTACEELAVGQRLLSDRYKAADRYRTHSLLTPIEFHDRALELARSIAFERALQGHKDVAA